MKSELEKGLSIVQEHIRSLEDKQQQQQSMQRLQQIVIGTAGLNAMVSSIQRSYSPEKPPTANVQAEFSGLQGRVMGLNESRAMIESQPLTVSSDTAALGMVERTMGMIGSLDWIDQQLDALKRGETAASFDSELSLILWSDYQTYRWQPNYLNYRFEGSPLRQLYPTLMVSRLEAPTLALTKGLMVVPPMIEEAGGLTGKVYLDARGIAKKPDEQVQSGSYADFDVALLQTAVILQKESKLPVTLNEQPELFQPGDCPDAAVYCGWYSLGKYVDAFTFKRGAIAYHLASNEAQTLRDPDSEVWCKKLLDDGVCATIGPVNEPYLSAFPRPNEFLPLLMRGKHTLVEAYYLTKPFNSWMMVLIGDPLYRPFVAAETSSGGE